MGAYESFASVYDLFMEDVNYDEWVDYVEKIFSEFNIKPELVLEAMAKMNGFEYDTLDYQIHRLEMYADKTAKKGEVHLLYSETPCSLVPLSEFGKQEMA